MTTRFKLGTDVRAWVEFEVTDATPEEIEVLSREDDESTALAAALDAAGRLVKGDVEYDDGPAYFADYATPAVLDFEVIEASQVGTSE
jgi:hypothetical protein